MPKVYYKQRYRLIIALILASVFFFFRDPSSLHDLKFLAIKVFTFPLNVIDNVSMSLMSRGELIAENTRLKSRIDVLLLKTSAFDELKKENDRLRDLASFRKSFDFRTVPAEIIGREPNAWAGGFIINKGTREGLVAHTAICSGKGLVGMLTDPGEEASMAVMITHPSFRCGGVLAGTRTSGVLAGAGTGKLKMLYIPLDKNVEPKEEVLTSGLSGIFPKGIKVGEVVSVHRSRTGLYQYAMIKPFADLISEEEVLCVLK
ncbi:MAG: rod shape-determining protein MreC [Candidatus Omnitrophica bacterium]|nr:rod shape-determining protein MreC [Candidatus Omnitrophota bacterium]